MAIYRVIGEHLVSEVEFAEKAQSISKLANASSADEPNSVALRNGLSLSIETFREIAAANPLMPQGSISAFPPVEFGKPVTIDIRAVYTGRVDSRGLLDNVFDRDGDIAVISGVKLWGAAKASSRALNFISQNKGKRTLIEAPSVFTSGTRIVAYERALTSNQISVGFEIRAVPRDDDFNRAISGAFRATAGIPIFLPYSGVLLAAGSVIPILGRLANSLFDGTHAWTESVDLNIDVPGYEKLTAGLRVVALGSSHLDHCTYREGDGLIEKDGSRYQGDEPYIVIAVYGGAQPELEHFSAAALTAEFASKFYPAKDGLSSSIDSIVEFAQLASDWRYRQKADELRHRIARLPADSEERQLLAQQLTAIVANIIQPELVGS